MLTILLFACSSGITGDSDTQAGIDVDAADRATATSSRHESSSKSTSVPGDTAVQRAIAAAALAKVGSAAPDSLYQATTGTTTWLTDIEGGDGGRMRAAIKDYSTYAAALSYCPADAASDLSTYGAATRTKMVSDFSGSSYDSTRKSALVDRIAKMWWFDSDYSVPTTEQKTLTYMGIRAQCKEFVDRTVKDGGGTSRTYGTAGITDIKNVRPGYYGFYPAGCTSSTCTHTYVVTSVYKDSTTGSITSLTLAESNYTPSDWKNPSGTTPWNRTITSRTVSSPTLSTATFVKPD